MNINKPVNNEIHQAFSKLIQTITQLSSWMDQNASSFAPLLLRLLLAYEFGESGLEKWEGENWFADLTFPFPINLIPVNISWNLATGFELLAPLALLLGVAVRFFSLALIVLTVVAIAAVHWPMQWHSLAELWQGYSITDHGYGNFKLPLMYIFMLGSLLLSGSGQLSLEEWLKANGENNETS